jgi:hypothetical protein
MIPTTLELSRSWLDEAMKGVRSSHGVSPWWLLLACSLFRMKIYTSFNSFFTGENQCFNTLRRAGGGPTPRRAWNSLRIDWPRTGVGQGSSSQKALLEENLNLKDLKYINITDIGSRLCCNTPLTRTDMHIIVMRFVRINECIIIKVWIWKKGRLDVVDRKLPLSRVSFHQLSQPS